MKPIGMVNDERVRTVLRELDGEVRELRERLTRVEKSRNYMTPYSDTDRPPATAVPPFTVIFNTSDNFPNVSDGKNWYDPTGSTT